MTRTEAAAAASGPTRSRFGDRVALITGAGHGIGRETARLLAAEGARVAVADIDPDGARRTCALIHGVGGEAAAFPADCSDWASVQALADSVIERYGRIDIVHANAGVLRPGSAIGQRIEDWDATFAVNVRGMFLLAKAVLPGMLERGSGVIVLTASTAGLLGEASIAAYCASKGAVVNLTRQLAVDYARHGIRVNCVCPGWIDTGFNDPMLEGVSDAELAEAIDRMVPLGRQGRPEEIAPVVAFLASDDAALIHGHALVADGGLTVQ